MRETTRSRTQPDCKIPLVGLQGEKPVGLTKGKKKNTKKILIEVYCPKFQREPLLGGVNMQRLCGTVACNEVMESLVQCISRNSGVIGSKPVIGDAQRVPLQCHIGSSFYLSWVVGFARWEPDEGSMVGDGVQAASRRPSFTRISWPSCREEEENVVPLWGTSNLNGNPHL